MGGLSRWRYAFLTQAPARLSRDGALAGVSIEMRRRKTPNQGEVPWPALNHVCGTSLLRQRTLLQRAGNLQALTQNTFI